MRRYCLTLDLKNDESLIRKYIDYHRNVWPEVLESIRVSGILQMQIYHLQARLVMIMDVDESFSFEKKELMDANNPKVQEWEALMDTYQQKLPFAKPDEKWVPMDLIFDVEF